MLLSKPKTTHTHQPRAHNLQSTLSRYSCRIQLPERSTTQNSRIRSRTRVPTRSSSLPAREHVTHLIPVTMNNSTFCELRPFQESYRGLHGYLSLTVCFFGSVANVLNICVLTMKQMRWPTNLILTGLAVADLLVMVEYVPFAVHEYILEGRRDSSHFSYGWAVFTVFHALFTQVFHFVSCCLTVILAVWRYTTLTYFQNSKVWCSMERTRFTIISTYLACPFVCLPLFLSLQVTPRQVPVNKNHVILASALKNSTEQIFKNETIFHTTYNARYKYASFWVYGVVIKLVPCILLTILSWKLIAVLVETKKRKKGLRSTNVAVVKIGDSSKNKQDEQQTDRTTRMLLAVLLLFLMTEFPQAILGLLSVTLGEKFERQCYIPLGE